MHTAPILCIAGPTAAGKSSLALKLAHDLNAEIISVDSLQVYKGFAIGSGKLPECQRAGITHHLIDLCEPAEIWNAQRFLTLAHQAISSIQQRDKLCIVVGGTTMYYTLLLHGLAALPAADLELRTKLEGESSQKLHEMLASLDAPAALRLHPSDRVRIIRAIEGAQAGVQGEAVRKAHGFSADSARALLLVLSKRRTDLYAAIDRRVGEMLKLGLVNEVKSLIERHGEELQGLQSLGYRQVLNFLKGELAEDKLESEIAMHTRRYAKRQMTFWRNEPAKRGWITRPAEGEEFVELKDDRSGRRARNDTRAIRVLSRSYTQILEEVKVRLMKSLSKNELWHIELRGDGEIFPAAAL